MSVNRQYRLRLERGQRQFVGTSFKTSSIPLPLVFGRLSSCRATISVGVADFELSPLLTAHSLKENGFTLWVMTATTQTSIGFRLPTISDAISSSLSGICTM